MSPSRVTNKSLRSLTRAGCAFSAPEIWKNAMLPSREKLTHPILPKEGCDNVLITSALPYVNNVPHVGNIIGCVLSADCYARYCRLRGYRVLYICGTDEYGTATEAKAIQEGLTPQAVCDKYYAIHAQVYRWFNISFDHFGRTTTTHQTRIAQDIFLKLQKNNCLLEDTMEQLFCASCQRFLADRFVEGTCPMCGYEDARGDQCDRCGRLINPIELKGPRCKICSSHPEVRTSTHLFLDLAKIEPRLMTFIEESQATGVWSGNAVSITQSWLREGLKPRCITRDLKWGTPVPYAGYENKVFYVWFDAPIGYISITACYTNHWERWWKNPSQVRLVHFMAKDNVPFHTVVFPCSLIGADDGYILMQDISSTEYLNYESEKFSKSRGIGVFGDNAIDSGIPVDVFRLYLLGNRPETQDSNFFWDELIAKNNNELINNLGNFIHRTLSLSVRSLEGEVRAVAVEELSPTEMELLTTVNGLLGEYIDTMEKYRLRDGLAVLMEVSRAGNQYIQTCKPWELMPEEPEHRRRLGVILSMGVQLVALVSVLLHPFAPESSERVMCEVNLPENHRVLPEYFVPLLPPGTRVQKPSILFSKIEPSLHLSLREKYSGQSQVATTSATARCDDLIAKMKDHLVAEFDKCSLHEIEGLIQAQNTAVEGLLLKKSNSKKLLPELGRLEVLSCALERKKNNSPIT